MTEGSSFSFIGGLADEGLSEPASSFSFITESANIDENQNMQNHGNMSGFDFLTAHSVVDSDASMQVDYQQNKGVSDMTSFNFLHHHSNSPFSESDMSNRNVRYFSFSFRSLASLIATFYSSSDGVETYYGEHVCYCTTGSHFFFTRCEIHQDGIYKGGDVSCMMH